MILVILPGRNNNEAQLAWPPLEFRKYSPERIMWQSNIHRKTVKLTKFLCRDRVAWVASDIL